MIITLKNTTSAEVASRIVELRDERGSAALSRVLTLLICVPDMIDVDNAIEISDAVSREHPCRVIVIVEPESTEGTARLNAQIRVGDAAGLSDIIILEPRGEAASNIDSLVMPLLQSDTPVVTYWPVTPPANPGEHPLGRLAAKRITDSRATPCPMDTLSALSTVYTPGDTDLAWGRITYWRALLVSALDQTPHEPIESASVSGLANEPALDLLAGWLASRIDGPVQRSVGELRVAVHTRSQTIELVRPQEGRVATLRRTGKPDSLITLARRDSWECLAEELRRLDPDEIYHSALDGITKVEYV